MLQLTSTNAYFPHKEMNILMTSSDLLTGNFGTRTFQWTFGRLMSAGSSLCCGVQEPALSPPTPATSWRTWSILTGSWWASHAYRAACFLLVSSIKHAAFAAFSFRTCETHFDPACMCVSVAFWLQNKMDFSGCFSHFDNGVSLHSSAVS